MYMRRLFYLLLLQSFFMAAVAQNRISRDYDDVSMSEALRQLNEESTEYEINFLYNELEDFRVTTNVRH